MDTIAQTCTHDFVAEVLRAEIPVLVDFYATWCPPCRTVVPILERLANEFPGVKFVKINVDEEPALSQYYQIAAVPTLILFYNGKAMERFDGVPAPHILRSKLAQWARPTAPQTVAG